MSINKEEKFCLRWNDFENNISSSFRELRDDKDFFDVTLVCNDNQVQAHKVILGACSSFFKSVLKKNPHQHPLLYLKGVNYRELISIINFMYHGETNIAHDDLDTFLSVAEDLKVKGLTQNKHDSPDSKELKTRTFDNKLVESQVTDRFTHQSKQEKCHPRNSTDNISQAKSYTPQIKTEAIGADEIYEVVEDDYIGEQANYEDDQTYQNNTSFNNMGHNENYMPLTDSNQDPYAHIKQYVIKVPNENGFSCTICGKKCRDMYLMREHIEGLHDMSPGYLCGVCNQQCKNHKGLKVHMKKFHSHS